MLCPSSNFIVSIHSLIHPVYYVKNNCISDTYKQKYDMSIAVFIASS